MLESALLLLLVVDPFGNLPFVLAVTGGAPPARYRRIIIRETVLALLVLVVFALAGDLILGYLQIERAALAVAGGVILFLISLKMIFQSVAQIFHDRYCAIFLLGRRISAHLGQRGLRAMEKFMGLLLNLVAVNMTLVGVKEFLSV
jgi:multiple antibiotic resistance protein